MLKSSISSLAEVLVMSRCSLAHRLVTIALLLCLAGAVTAAPDTAVPSAGGGDDTAEAHIRELEIRLRDAGMEQERLAAEVAALQSARQALQDENRSLAGRSDREWFVAGALVVMAGILLGIFLPRLRLRGRRSGWDRF